MTEVGDGGGDRNQTVPAATENRRNSDRNRQNSDRKQADSDRNRRGAIE
jgi:hypothetical protein